MLRRKLYLLLIAIIFSPFLVSSLAHAAPTISGSNQMSAGQSQTLSVVGAVPGETYTWSIVSGGGNLTPLVGTSVTYTAPDANPNCSSNSKIQLRTGDSVCDTVTISINSVTNHYDIVLVDWSMYNYPNVCLEPNAEWIATGCCVGKPRPPYWPPGTTNLINMYWSGPSYYCDGTYAGEQTDGIQCGWSWMPTSLFTCEDCKAATRAYDPGGPTAWGHFWHNHPAFPGDGMIDYRTDVQKAAGCCPAQLLNQTPSTPQPNDTGSPPSIIVCINSSTNLKSGNLYHDQNAGILTLSYNSLDPDNGPVGLKWTHNYNVQLTALSDNATIVLKTEDGNIINFRLSGGVYYPEAISGDTSQIIKYANGTYTRTTKNGTAYNFNSSGSLTSIIDRNSNTTTLTYSGNDLASVTDPAGRTTTVTAAGGKITSITDPGGRTYSLAYTNGILSSVTDPLGNAWLYTYDTVGKMLTKTDPTGNAINYTYDTSGRLSQSTAPDGTRQMNYAQTGTTTFTEKDGGLWTYTYDPIFAVKTAMTDPLGNTTRYAYDAKRNLTATTAPDGSVTGSTYDSNGNVTSTTDPLGNITGYTYNSMNLVTSRTDPKAAVTTYTYDTKGNLITVTDPAGAVTTYQYDARGNVTAMTDANNQTTVLAYDTQNNLTSITDPLNRATAFTYDAVGNRLSMTDPLGNVASYVYNGLNQMTQVTDPKGNITYYTYDYKGSVLSTTDANGKPTNYAYNYRGQVTQITDALNNLTKMTYGPGGCGSSCGGAEKLAALTDALNHSTQYTYDLAGRLTKETDPLGKEINYTYDAKGNLITKTKPDGKTITYTYDTGNRLTRKQYSDNSVTQFQYDANGNMTYAGNPFMAYNFAYDSNNRMTGVTDSNSRSIQYQYNLLGNRTTMITPENRTIAYAYDAAGRLTAITADSHIFSLNYDAAGRRTGLSYPNNTAAAYTYDYNGNLTRLRHTGTGGTTLADINYTYDNINNRLTRTDTATSGSDPASNETMSYDAANELLNVNAATYTYDLNGNRIQKTDGSTGTAYTYDDENRLIRVEITGVTTTVITYAYDPFGRRIEKNVNGTITRYLYDRQAVILEYNQAGTVQARYTHGPGIDEPLAMEKDSLMYYYHADGLGSIIALTNTSGGVAQRYNYDAFGNITSGAPTVTQPYTYTAREYDPETGLYFYRARYYDPKAGRFLTRDPIGFDGGDYNLYAYVSNNPVNKIDPVGLKECCDCPGGEWSSFSWPSSSLFFGGGGTLARTTYKCKSNNKTCKATSICFGGGPMIALGIGIDFGGYPKFTKGVEGASCVSDLKAFSSGVYFTGGPFSATVTGSSANTGISKSWGAGAAYVTCFSIDLSCN
jgi:RHS repeat-associated protein